MRGRLNSDDGNHAKATLTEETRARLQESRREFLALVEGIRPDLHRYCARMTGSVAEGEDVVQETLARAFYELAELRELPSLRFWLFSIAHNRVLDSCGATSGAWANRWKPPSKSRPTPPSNPTTSSRANRRRAYSGPLA